MNRAAAGRGATRRARCALCFVAALAAACAPAVRTAPNVVLVVVDTLRADRLGTYGYRRGTSPNLDALAARSLVFENAVTAAPWTTPAVGAILTGLPPLELGQIENASKIGDEFTMLAEILRQRGYVTGGIISHLFLDSRLGFGRGFDEWNQEEARGHEHVSSPRVTDLAVDFLRRHAESDEPFFLFVHYFDPHYDYIDHGYSDLMRPYHGELKSQHDNIMRLRRHARAGRYGPDDVRHLNDLYDSEVRFTDRHLGRLLTELQTRGLDERTLVIVTADHGEALMDRPDHWIGHTHTLFEELIHVPLLVKPPGSGRSARIATPVSTTDLLPTVLEVVGASDSKPHGVLGRSLLGEIHQRPVLSATYREAELQMVRRGRFKLIHNLRRGRSVLFDLADDPGERVDVAGDHPEVVAELERLRRDWYQRSLAELGDSVAEVPELTAEELKRLKALGY